MDNLSIWFNNKPVQPKYLQVAYTDILEVLGKEKFEKFCEGIYNHHCQFATKEGMFVIEQFFGRDPDDYEEISFVMKYMIEYIENRGFEVNPEFYEHEGVPLAKGFDGVLVNWTW